MRDIAAWVLGFVGTILQAQVFKIVRDNMPEILKLSEGVESITTAIGSVVGLLFLWIAYKLKLLSVREKELDIQKKERELAEDKTDLIVDRVLKKMGNKE